MQPNLSHLQKMEAPLLHNAEQNIGKSFELLGPNGPVTSIAEQNPQRLLQLSGDSRSGQTTSIVLTARRTIAVPGSAGPITGIIEFGNGGRSTKAEVDIPIGPYVGNFVAPSVANEPQDGGVIVSVPTGVIRAYARYDSNFITPMVGFPNAVGYAQQHNLVPIGPNPGANPGLLKPTNPVLVQAMAAYFNRHWAASYKTQYCYCDFPGGASVNGAQQIQGAGYCVPPFAKSAKILRIPQTAAMVLTTWDSLQGASLESFAIPSGPSPTIQIQGTVNVVSVESATAGDTVTFFALVYEIGI